MGGRKLVPQSERSPDTAGQWLILDRRIQNTSPKVFHRVTAVFHLGLVTMDDRLAIREARVTL
jgi:hypothetical protein